MNRCISIRGSDHGFANWTKPGEETRYHPHSPGFNACPSDQIYSYSKKAKSEKVTQIGIFASISIRSTMIHVCICKRYFRIKRRDCDTMKKESQNQTLCLYRQCSPLTRFAFVHTTFSFPLVERIYRVFQLKQLLFVRAFLPVNEGWKFIPEKIWLELQGLELRKVVN